MNLRSVVVVTVAVGSVALSACGGGNAHQGTTRGSLGDLFKGGHGSNQGDQVIQKKIDTAQKQLQVNPKNTAALTEVIRGHYELATARSDPNTGQFTNTARPDLQQAATAWEHYLATNPKPPDLGLARVMVQAYAGLAQLSAGQSSVSADWAGAANATELIAAAQPTPNNYIALVQYATLAGQTSKADLAGKKAVSLAPKSQRRSVQQQVAAAKAAGQSQAGGTTP